MSGQCPFKKSADGKCPYNWQSCPMMKEYCEKCPKAGKCPYVDNNCPYLKDVKNKCPFFEKHLKEKTSQ